MSTAKFIFFVLAFLVVGIAKSFGGEMRFIVTESRRANRECAVQQVEEFRRQVLQNAELAVSLADNVDVVEIAVFNSRWSNRNQPHVAYSKSERRMVLMVSSLERSKQCLTVSREELIAQSRLIVESNRDYAAIVQRKAKEINAAIGRDVPVTPAEGSGGGRSPASVK